MEIPKMAKRDAAERFLDEVVEMRAGAVAANRYSECASLSHKYGRVDL
jgi:hypothetical protein